MEKEFFDLYSKHPILSVEVGHNSIADWGIYVYDRRGKETGNWGNPVVQASGCDRSLVFAEAYVRLAEYFSEKLGGY